MMVRTDQLLWIKEATHTKVHTWESEAEAHGQMKTLAQSLKQPHACFIHCMKRAQLEPWLAFKGYTQMVYLDTQTSPPALG